MPLNQIKLPSILGLPILDITEITQAAPAAPAAPAVTVPGITAEPSAGEAIAGEAITQAQRTTGKKKRVPRTGERALDSAGNLIQGAVTKVQRARPEKTKLRFPDGVPTLQNPTMSLALPGPVAVGVPNFFIDKFRIPVFLLSIYQAAGIQYEVPWEVLAAINEIETNYGRNLNVSSAGAVGWMQFIPSSWKAYGVDANGDGKKDPYNPVDAIFAAARYLKAAGAQEDLRKAIFAYNHADWYVNSVLMRARFIGGMPADLVGSLSGLTQGRFPVHAKSMYADDISERAATRRVARGKNAALPVESTSRRGINIFAKAGSRVIAVQDGTIVKVGNSRRLGNFVILRDVYGNSYTYAGLKKVATQVLVPKEKHAEQGVDRQGAVAAEGQGAREGRERRAQRRQGRLEGRRHGGHGHRVRRGRGREGAAVRQPDAPEGAAGRRQAPAHGVRVHARRGRLELVLLLRGLRPQEGRRRAQAAGQGPPGHRRHGPRSHRPHVRRARTAHAVRDPARGPRRAADRPEADPRRLEGPRGHGHLPRAGQEPVLRGERPGRHDRPDPADEQGGARTARPREPADRGLLVRPS